MLKIAKHIQTILGKNDLQMSQLLGGIRAYQWEQFKKSTKRVGIRNLVMLWRVSGLSGNEFMERLEKEINK